MIHKIETINNLHTSYKLSRWKVLTKGLTKTVYIILGLRRERNYLYWAMYSALNRNLKLYIKISFFVIRETVTVEYVF